MTQACSRRGRGNNQAVRIAVLLLLVLTGLLPAETPPDTPYAEAFAAFRAGQLEEAEQRVDALLTQATPPPRALELKGRILHARGRFKDAQDFYFRALEADPTLASAHFHLGESAFRLGDWADALQYYSVHLREQRGSRLTALKLIYCHVITGNLTEAARWMQALDPRDELDPAYYFARAALARASGKNPEAAEALRQARTLYGNEIYLRHEPDYLFVLRHLPATPSAGPERP